MKILITGGTGLLGKALVETADSDMSILATYVGNYEMADTEKAKYTKLDVLDAEGYNQLFAGYMPEVIIHAASIGSPDFAEKNKEITWKINVEGTRRIVALCEEFGTKFIYISSNGIYDGDKAPYGEDDLAEPINYYGLTKLEGEAETKRSKVPFSIVRPILMYGWSHKVERGNIVTFAISKLRQKERVSAYEDVYCNPLYVEDCAAAIWKIIKDDKYETFNLAGGESVSICQLLKIAASVFGLPEELIDPVRQGFFNELVKRPKDTSYDTSKMENVLGIKPAKIKDCLIRMKRKEKWSEK